MAGNAQQDAANQASDVSLAVAQDNNALARDMYSANAARLDPYSTMGLAAGDQYMGMLLGHAPTSGSAGNGWAPVVGNSHPSTPTPGSTGSTGAPATYTGPSMLQILAMKDDGIPGNYQSALNAYNAWYASHPQGGVTSALAPFAAAPTTPVSSPAVNPQTIAQQASAAIAAGADPAAVRARAASYGVHLQ
jgi:hypothetical protein